MRPREVHAFLLFYISIGHGATYNESNFELSKQKTCPLITSFENVNITCIKTWKVDIKTGTQVGDGSECWSSNGLKTTLLKCNDGAWIRINDNRHRRKRGGNCPDVVLEADPGKICKVHDYVVYPVTGHYYFVFDVPPGKCYPEGRMVLMASLTAIRSAWCWGSVTVIVHYCPMLIALNFGSMRCSGDRENVYGSTCSFSCNAGYILDGPENITCGNSSSKTSWSADVPSCVALCPELPVYPFGRRTCTGGKTPDYRSYNTQCQHSCNTNFRLSGVSTIRCVKGYSSSYWSNESPKCEVNVPPDLSTCRVSVIDSQGDNRNSRNIPNVTICNTQQNGTIKWQPRKLFVSLKAGLNFPITLPPRVSTIKVGVTGLAVTVETFSVSGDKTIIQSSPLTTKPICNQNVNSRSPVTGGHLLECETTLTMNNISLTNSESICAYMEAFSGGYYDVLNLYGNIDNTVAFLPVTAYKRVCFLYDDNLETIRDDLKKKENPQLQSEDVANLVSKVEQNLGGNATVSTSNETKVVVDILNELFQTSTEELKTAESTNGSASRLLGMVETLLTKVELTNDQFQTTSTQLFVAVRQNVTSGLTLTAYDKDFNGNFEGDEVKIDFNSEVPKEESVNSLVLPDSLFTNNNLSSSRIILVSYLSDNLYEVVRQAHAGNQTKAPKDTSYVRKINSHVLAASIIGSNFILTDPIVITLVHHEKNSKNATCVFWNDTQKDWSTKGCELDSSSSTQFRSSCRCDHLTSFALLMDVYQEGESSSVLSALSIIGCCVSLSSLLITIITYGILIALGDKRPCLKERREQRDVPHKILLNLCSALVLSNVVYLTGWIEHIPKPPVVCKVAAAMLHFFLLGAFCWMAVEAYYMYLVLVQVFKTNFTNFALKCSIFGWGVPLLVVAITLGVNKTDNYQNIQDNVCWLKGIAFYVAFVTPVCLVLVMNFAIFGLVLRRMMGLSGNKSISGPSFTVKRQLRGAIGVIILLGLTWIFAFLNTNKASPVFAYLFVIFNPLQGTFIFLYYCIMREDIRVIWLRWLYCGQADVIVISNQEDFTSRNAEQEHEKHPENSGKYQVLEEASTNRILQKANSKKNKRPGSKLAVDTSKTTMTTVSESIADSEI